MQSFLMNRSERPMTNTEKRDLIQLVLVQADPTLADLMISQAVDSVEAIFHSKKVTILEIDTYQSRPNPPRS